MPETNPQARQDIYQQVSDLLDHLAIETGRQDLDPEFGAVVVPNLQASLASTGSDLAPLITTVQRYLQTADQWKTSLASLLENLKQSQTALQNLDRNSQEWVQEQVNTVTSTGMVDPMKAIDEWMRIFIGALCDWSLATCTQLAGWHFPFPDWFEETRQIFVHGANALLDGAYDRALPMLDFLAPLDGHSGAPGIITAEQQAAFMVLSGRIYLDYLVDPENAQRYFNAAGSVAPECALVDAGKGEFLLSKAREKLAEADIPQESSEQNGAMESVQRKDDELGPARQCFEFAIRKNPSLPDGYLGMGLYMEALERWEEADDWYTKAAETVDKEPDIIAAFSRLLAPSNGNAYLQLARTLSKSSPDKALVAANNAINLGMNGDGDYPERLAYRVRGNIYETLGSLPEAASDFFEAGTRFYWRNEFQLAKDLLENSIRADPQRMDARWYLADALQVLGASPKPPDPVNEEILRLGIAVWSEAARLQLPGVDFSWTYATRGLLNEWLLLLPREKGNSWDLLWEAVAFYEQALLYQPENTDRLVSLLSKFRVLDAYQNALEIASRLDEAATDLEDYQRSALLDETATLYADLRQLDRALQNIDAALAIEDNAWRKYLKGYVLNQQDRNDEALACLEAAVSGALDLPECISYQSSLAGCYQDLGRLDDARKTYTWIWERRNDERYAGYADTIAWAAFELSLLSEPRDAGLLDKAIEMMEPLLQDPIYGASGKSTLGLFFLVRASVEQNDLNRGEELTLAGIQGATRVSQVEGVLEDLEDVRRHLTSPRMPEILGRIQGACQEKRAVLEKYASPESELRLIIEQAATAPASPPWTAANICLARVLFDQQRYPEAFAIYKSLHHQAVDLFLEGAYATQRCIQALREHGDELLTSQQPQEAAEQYQIANGLLGGEQPSGETGQGDEQRIALLLAQALLETSLGYAWLVAGEKDRARQSLQSALEKYLHAGDSGSSAGDTIRSQEVSTANYWQLVDLFEEMKATSDGEMQAAIDNTLLAMRNDLIDQFQLESAAASTASRLLLANPISIEMTGVLIPEDTGENWALIKSYLPELRERLQAEMGISVPFINLFRNGGSFPDGAYQISLFGVPEAYGGTSPERVYVIAAAEALAAIGIPAEDVEQSSHPITGEPGCWVAEKHAALLEEKKYTVWNDPLHYMVAHLEQVLRNNMDQFLGVQECEALLANWSADQELLEQIRRTLPEPADRVKFSRLLRALLHEGVPLIDPARILQAVEVAGISASQDALLQAARHSLRDLLPGNQAGASRLLLTEDLEWSLRYRLEAGDGGAYLCAPPGEVQDWLNDLSQLAQNGKPSCLVVKDSQLRAPLARLVEMVNLDLKVLSEAEVAEGEVQ